MPFTGHGNLPGACAKTPFSWVLCGTILYSGINSDLQVTDLEQSLPQVLDTYISLRSRRLNPSPLVQGDNWYSTGIASSLSTDRILADETSIHLFSSSLMQCLEDESFWVFTSWVGERRFPHSWGKVVEYYSIRMARDGLWQKVKGRKIYGRENKCNGLDAL